LSVVRKKNYLNTLGNFRRWNLLCDSTRIPERRIRLIREIRRRTNLLWNTKKSIFENNLSFVHNFIFYASSNLTSSDILTFGFLLLRPFT
jgi:hypothetical protein